MNDEKIFTAIRQWHYAHHRTSIEESFKLGDMILSAVIHAGINENQVILRIIKDLGEIALGETTYQRAAKISRTYTPVQRQILIEKCLPVLKADILAGESYSPVQRTKMVQRIRSGIVKVPWACIKTLSEKRNESMKKALNSDIERYSGEKGGNSRSNRIAVDHADMNSVSSLKVKGEWDEDAVVNLLCHLVTAVPFFDQALIAAKRRAGKI